MATIEDVWSSLNTRGEQEDSYVRLRLPEVTACASYAARRVADGHEAIIIEISKDAIPPGVEYPESRGFEVRAIPLDGGRGGSTRLVLSLTDSRFRDVFLALGVDLAAVLASAQTEREAVESFVSRLARWQAFLRSHGFSGLSAEARRGLVGELLFLRDKLLPVGARTAVQSWKGPQGARHDFQLPTGSVEVKTTSAASPHSFRVNNVLQLDETNVSALFVCLILLQESESSGENLPAIVRSIRTLLTGHDLGEFDDSLLQAGYLDRQTYLYHSPGYAVRSRRFFRVASGFPRFLESDVPPGVMDLSYSVAVASCLEFICEEEAVMRALREGETGGH